MPTPTGLWKWTPVLPTPNHPEYPAAHSCTSGSLGEALRHFYGTPNVTYTFDSRVTGTTRIYTGTDAFNKENQLARIAGGMHFNFAATAGEELGKRIADWVATRHFGRQDQASTARQDLATSGSSGPATK